jgi:hypothetical protein
VQGPDGALYVTQDANPGNIYRVEPVDLPDPTTTTAPAPE